jgi:hypothetical protein
VFVSKDRERKYRREWMRAWRKANPEKNKAYVSAWKKAHPDHVERYRHRGNEARKQWWRKQARLKTNAHFAKNLRTRVYLALKGKRKLGKTEELLSCSISALRSYIQNLFQPGMTWNNYGKWHIDHKIPCSKFNLLELDGQKRCFHFSNLQPLWAHANISKGAKVVTA